MPHYREADDAYPRTAAEREALEQLAAIDDDDADPAHHPEHPDHEMALARQQALWATALGDRNQTVVRYR